jgi:hypothetical protein
VATVFDPQDLAIISGAYQQACDALRFAFVSHEPEAVEKTQTELAKLVLEVAKVGHRDPSTISTEALRRMPPLQADWRE